VHHYLAEAVVAYREALEVYTRKELSQQWAMTQNNLAQAYTALEDWPHAAASYANVIRMYPDDTEAYQAASFLYHEKLFAFPEAFALNQQWLKRHPEDLAAQSDFAERLFNYRSV
jgi:tetratricopeptide (TPR) repeat protein